MTNMDCFAQPIPTIHAKVRNPVSAEYLRGQPEGALYITSFIPAIPAAWSVTTIAFIIHLLVFFRIPGTGNTT